MEAQLLLAIDLGFIKENEVNELTSEITREKKLLNGFINYFKKTINDQPTTANETFEEYGNNE